jgi:catechol 2,3-dioxygenase-like lactoylglutathione lyase family enzyme
MISLQSTHANFSVNDIDQAKEFYVNKLGLRLYKEREGNIVLQSASESKVNIYLKEDHIAWDSTILGIEVDDLESAIDELASNGVVIEKLPGTDERGILHDDDMGDAAWCKDPGGNWVCISIGL